MALHAPAMPTDGESRGWLRDLRAGGATADDGLARLRALLLHAARFEVARRRAQLPLSGEEADELAAGAADDALVNVRARLGDFSGDRRFTTWACKFAILEASVRVRRRAWGDRELPPEADSRSLDAILGVENGPAVEPMQLASTVNAAVAELLTPHERRVLFALTLHAVPIDVLAEREGTTRAELYETLHGARRKLRGGLAAHDACSSS